MVSVQVLRMLEEQFAIIEFYHGEHQIIKRKRWAEAARGSPAGPLLTKLASSRASLSGARALAGPTAGKQTDHVGEAVSERLEERRSRPLVYRSSVRLLLLPVMARRGGIPGPPIALLLYSLNVRGMYILSVPCLHRWEPRDLT